MMNSHRNGQSGNAFWIILLAIALLVAMTITVTRSTESTQDTGRRDRNRIMASDILRQGKSLQQAVQQLSQRGVAENQMNFDNDVVAGYANTRCGNAALNTDDLPCGLFKVEGTGLAYKIPPAEWLDGTQLAQSLYGEWYFYANACIADVGTGGAGCNATDSATELIAALPWITEGLCIEINRQAGVANLTGPVRPPVLSGSAYPAALTRFTGTFTADSEITAAGGAFTGHQAGCFQGAAGSVPDGGYHFYQVLVAR